MVKLVARKMELAELVAFLKNLTSPPVDRAYSAMAAQVLRRTVWGVFPATGSHPAIAIGGLMSSPSGAAVVWFEVAPERFGLGPSAIVRAGRLIIKKSQCANRVCFVSVNNQNGQRLARLFGFEPTNNHVGPMQEWKWIDGKCSNKRGSSMRPSTLSIDRAAPRPDALP